MRTIMIGLVIATLAQGARIEGRVVTPDGKPVAGAQVRIQDEKVPAAPGEHLETASAQGTFVAELAAGGYRVRARLAGYMAPDEAVSVAVTLKDGETRAGIEIVLLPMGVVAGTVVNADGNPVAGARVEVLWFFTAGTRRLTLSSERPAVTTDDRGEYRMLGVRPGMYFVRVNQAGAGREANLTTYYPANDFTGAQPVKVDSGTVLRVDLRMRRGPVFGVRGRLEGAPANGRIELAMEVAGVAGVEPRVAVTSARAGIFEARGLPPGEYTLTARWNPPARSEGKLLFGEVRVNVTNADVGDVVVRLQEGLQLTGRFLVEGEEWKQFMEAPAEPNFPRRMPSLTFMRLDEGRAAPVTRNDAEGTFTVRDAMPGRYDMVVAAVTRGYFLKSVRLDGKDVTQQTLDLRAGGALEIVLKKGGGSLVVELPEKVPADKNNGRPPTLLMWPEVRQASDLMEGLQSSRVRADAPPRSWVSLAPGDYYVAILEELTSPDVARVTQFFERLKGQAKRVTVRDGEEAKVVAPVIGVEAAERAFAEVR